MTLQELLNSDVNSIGQWARGALAWWLDELSATAPAWLRRGLSGRPKHLVEPVEGGGWLYWSNGRPTPDGRAARRAGARVGLVLPTNAALVRTLTYPRLPIADLRRMLTLDIDRLSPISPDLVYHDMRVLDRDGAGGERTILLGLLPRDLADRFLAAASADGLNPTLVAVASGDGATDYRFDFLPAIRRENGLPDEGRARRYWWAAVAALALVNIGALVGRDMVSVARLREAVDQQRPAVGAVMGVRRRVEAQDGARRVLIARGQRNDPLEILAALTGLLPPSAWVQRLEWNGQVVRLVGFKSGDVDLAAVLRSSPEFANPRAAAALTPRKGVAAQPFDITADVGKRPHS